MDTLTDNDIREMFHGFTGIHESTLVAVVKDVSESDCTCTLDDDGIDIPEVRLNPIVGTNKGIVKIPKVGSYVVAVKIENNDGWTVINCTEYESILLIVGRTKVKITDGEIEVNDGTLGGIIKISDLTNKLNALVNSFNTHTHTVATPDTLTGTAAPVTSQARQFNASDYEDTAFKH